MTFDTLYLGGGTPSLLEPDEVAWLRQLVAGGFRTGMEEFTLEVNPGGEGISLLRGWLEAGVNRLSVGVQSFDDGVLDTLGRPYKSVEAFRFCRSARETGFGSLALDLMTGIPGETPESALRTIRTALDLDPDHVSVYFLENVEGLPFEGVLARRPVDEDASVEAFRAMRDELETAGLRQYEISNFAREGKECRHNLKYWRYQPFLGLGPSACSHLEDRRWCNKPSLSGWAEALARGADPREEEVELGPESAALEALAVGLRLVEGVDISELAARFGVDVGALRGREIEGLVADGLLLREGRRLRIPADRFFVSNAILSRLI